MFDGIKVAQLENFFPHSLERYVSSKAQIFNMRNTPRLKLNFQKNLEVCIWSHLLQKNSTEASDQSSIWSTFSVQFKILN